MTSPMAIEISNEGALLAARAAQSAYFNQPTQAIHPPPLGTKASLVSAEMVQAMIFDRPDGCFVVAFRGTDESRDWCRSFDFDFDKGPLGGRVHDGFLSAWEDVRRDILPSIGLATIRGQQIILCGHSLGGAIATLAHADLRALHIVATCYSFGSPRVGDAGFVHAYAQEGLDDLHYRMTREGDAVPDLPPAFLGFRHVGKHFYATEAGVASTCSGSLMEHTRTREQRTEVPTSSANGKPTHTHIIREWTHSHIALLANGSSRAHALCEWSSANPASARARLASEG